MSDATETETAAEVPRPLPLRRNHGFRMLWIGQLLSDSGSEVGMLANNSNPLVSLWGAARRIAYFMRAGRCKHSRRHEGDFGRAKHRRFAPARRHGVRLTRPTNSLSLQVIR
jgi:hypothetical protein